MFTNACGFVDVCKDFEIGLCGAYSWSFSLMFVFHGRDGLRAVRLIIPGPKTKRKMGQLGGRPSLTTKSLRVQYDCNGHPGTSATHLCRSLPSPNSSSTMARPCLLAAWRVVTFHCQHSFMPANIARPFTVWHRLSLDHKNQGRYPPTP
jgi:hypothetical protein